MTTFITLFIPLIGTALGSAMVFFLKGKISPRTEKSLLGFAAGVMIAASVWSLLIPSIDMATAQGIIPWLPAAVGFLCGIGFLLLLDELIPHLHLGSSKPEGLPAKLPKCTMMLFAVMLHNIPEGMTTGVALAGSASEEAGISAAAALALAIGIALQNFPEGAIVSMPLCSEGMSRTKAFWLGTLSGAVEPIAGFLTMLFAAKVTVLLPYLLSFAAGAMIYVVVEELVPDAQAGEHSNAGTITTAIGFVVMMILGVALG